jgi:RNA polymerase sigma-70 factor (ECF subfamily)
MDSQGSFEQVMARLRDGDPAAAAEVFNRFAHRLLALARVRLDGRMRQKMDPEDVLQSVFRSFFSRQAGGQFDLANWESLWGMLTAITLRKCGRRIDYFRAARRNVQREIAPAGNGSFSGWDALAGEPTPSEAAMLTETLEQLMRQLDEQQRSILSLSLQGCSSRQISEQAGCTERTVRRVLERIRKQLHDLCT